MKTFYRNYFKEGKLYQWDQSMNIYSISDTNISGEFCLDQKGMDTLIKFGNPVVELGKTLKVVSKNLKATIRLIDATLQLPNLEFNSECIIDADRLKKAAKFVPKKANNPVLQGVSIKQGLILASDSYIACQFEIEGGMEIILPVDFINELGNEKQIKLHLSDKNVMFIREDGSQIISRLIIGEYPQLEKLFANKGDKEFKINKSDLMSVLSFSNTGVVRLESGLIKVISEESEFELETNISLDERISLSLNNLKTILNLVSEEEITFKYYSATKPIFITNTYLILPLQEA